MKNLFIALVFVLVSTFAFGNNSIEKEIDSIKVEKNADLQTYLEYAKINIYSLNGICYFHMEITGPQGDIIQTFDISWESQSESSCESESNILARFLMAPYL